MFPHFFGQVLLLFEKFGKTWFILEINILFERPLQFPLTWERNGTKRLFKVQKKKAFNGKKQVQKWRVQQHPNKKYLWPCNHAGMVIYCLFFFVNRIKWNLDFTCFEGLQSCCGKSHLTRCMHLPFQPTDYLVCPNPIRLCIREPCTDFLVWNQSFPLHWWLVVDRISLFLEVLLDFFLPMKTSIQRVMNEWGKSVSLQQETNHHWLFPWVATSKNTVGDASMQTMKELSTASGPQTWMWWNDWPQDRHKKVYRTFYFIWHINFLNWKQFLTIQARICNIKYLKI